MAEPDPILAQMAYELRQAAVPGQDPLTLRHCAVSVATRLEQHTPDDGPTRLLRAATYALTALIVVTAIVAFFVGGALRC